MHVRFRDTLPGLARQNYNYAKGLRLPHQALRGAPAAGAGCAGGSGATSPPGAALVPEYFAVTFGPRKGDPLAQAVFRWNRAGAAGKIAGMLRYRSLPP